MVIAVGGNALIKKNQQGTIYEQFANTRIFTESLIKIIEHGWDVVLTHGNGPQVGSILLQNEAGKDLTPAMPLGICVAESQGYIGYMIQQCVANALHKNSIEKDVVSLITQVIVSKDDPAMDNPTKPIGPYYDKKRAQELIADGYTVVEQSKGWRIIVPSPDPLAIVEGTSIKKLLDNGVIVIAAGGGGMPVCQKSGWGYDGIEAVVDKDLSAERIAEAVHADVLMILSNVDFVYTDFGTTNQQALKHVSLSTIKKLFDQGQFPKGSMGPKILASIRFLEAGGLKAIIGHIDHGWEVLHHEKGTVITP